MKVYRELTRISALVDEADPTDLDVGYVPPDIEKGLAEMMAVRDALL